MNKPLILIIEDNELSRDIMKRVLGNGYRYYEAENGMEGIEMMIEHSEEINLILLDVEMPIADGFTVLEEMNRQGWIDMIPVIMVSADETQDHIKKSYRMGALDFISKNTAAIIIQNRVRNSIHFFMKQSKKLKRANEEIRSLSDKMLMDEMYDQLTRCLSKNAFYLDAERFLLKYTDEKYSLVYADINNLTYINNEYGYETGNQLLRMIGDTGRELLHERELLCRFAGDRFVALISGVLEEKYHVELFREAQRRMNVFLEQNGIEYNVELYTGMCNVDWKSLENYSVAQLVDFASVARKEAKKKKNHSIEIYDANHFEKQKREALLMHALESALANNEFEIWYQPQIDCRNRSVVGAEALCRWNSPTLGWISPGEFIPLFESSGQIGRLDAYVWDKVCAQMQRWLMEGNIPFVPVSVNVSRKDILDMQLEEIFLGLMQKYDLEAEMLRIEITEGAYLNEARQLIDVVRALKKAGFTVEMDDFGSGYSSLNMLKEVPVDVLKLDLGFLRKGENGNGGSIISSVIRMAKGINLTVIAEGVETEEQCVALRNMGCSIIQGYYFAKPMPVHDYENYLKSNRATEMFEKHDTAEMLHLRELLDHSSNSSYIFDHYNGSAAIMELNEKRIEVLKVNDRFLKAMGDEAGEFLQYINDALGMVQEEDREDVFHSFLDAVEKGEAECETYLPDTGQWIKLHIRLILPGEPSSYLFCEAYNTSQMHLLGEEYRKLIERTRDTMDSIPSGIFRYEADGEQRFSFVSTSTLWLLGYRSINSFLRKFDNRFPNMIYVEDRERVLNEIRNQIDKNGRMDYCEYRVEMEDGTLKWVYDYGQLVTDENGKKWFYVVITDLDNVKRERKEMSYLSRRYEMVAHATRLSTFDYDYARDYFTAETPDGQGGWRNITISNYLMTIEEQKLVNEKTLQTIQMGIEKAKQTSEEQVAHVESRLSTMEYKTYEVHFAGVYDENQKLERIVGYANLS